MIDFLLFVLETEDVCLLLFTQFWLKVCQPDLSSLLGFYVFCSVSCRFQKSVNYTEQHFTSVSVLFILQYIFVLGVNAKLKVHRSFSSLARDETSLYKDRGTTSPRMLSETVTWFPLDQHHHNGQTTHDITDYIIVQQPIESRWKHTKHIEDEWYS